MKEQKYYYGNAISEYGLENGRVDYATLAKAFDAVLNNDIMNLTYDIGSWEQVSGIIDNTDEIEELEEKRIVDIKGVINEIPNMNLNKTATGTLSASFRGLTGSAFTQSNPVVIYIDGVPYYDNQDYNPSLLNVEQIEVLRGPQGTLYGKDSQGGVINIITKTPTNEWKGSINNETTRYNRINE